jgi:2-C-methyl-D-erythritol 4-phosphate cytidylyltransferase
MNTTLIIPAAGSGTRFGAPLPKQFVALAGVPIIVRTLQVIEQTSAVQNVVIAATSDFHATIAHLKQEYHLAKIESYLVYLPYLVNYRTKHR